MESGKAINISILLILIQQSASDQLKTSDFEPDGDVDFDDFSRLLSAWLTNETAPQWDCRFDIAEPDDGVVSFPDFSEFARQWMQ